MNIQTHRLVFNRSRGSLMAVGENARSCGGRGGMGRMRRRRCMGNTSNSGMQALGEGKSPTDAAGINLSISIGASYNASSASIGIGTTGGSAGIGSDKGSAANTTQAAISGMAGNQDARTGDAETGITAIFDKERVKQEVAAQVQITQAFGQQASKAWGDYTDKRMREALASGNPEEAAEAEKWAEGGIYRAAGHTVIGGLGGGASGTLGAGLSSTEAPWLNELQDQMQAGLEKAGLPKDVAKGLAGMASGATVAALGNAAGGSAGAMGAFNQDANNRQLHPTEAKLIKDNAKAYAQKRFGTANPSDEQISQAQAELTQQALRDIDSAHDARLGEDNTQAQAFLNNLGAGQTQTDSLTGQRYQLFSADATTRDNHAMFGQYAKTSPTVEGALDLAYSRVFYPKDGQTIAGLNGTAAGALSGSDLALNDAARDYRDMRQQPAVVQWAVLGELRGERKDNLQTQLQLTQELQTLNAQGDTSAQAAQRRGEIMKQLSLLEHQDQVLRQASVEQLKAMGSVGTLNPASQREWTEGSGEAIAAAGLSGKGVSASSINGRINALKGAIEEVQATTAAAKAEVQAIAKAKVESNARTDDSQQYDQFRKPDSTRPGGEWDWQKNAPNDGAVPGTQKIVTIQTGQTLDRYGSRYGEYMSPAGTPYEARALPPGKQAETYEKYQVLKPFQVVQEKIAPAFDQTGGGIQMRAYMPEYFNGTRPAPVEKLFEYNYLGETK